MPRNSKRDRWFINAGKNKKIKNSKLSIYIFLIETEWNYAL